MPDQSLADCRILVVEDAYSIADDIGMALRAAGAVVVGPAPNGRVALSLLCAERVDAAVLDINLHGETVYSVADMLLARGKPFVFASGYAKSSIPEAYRDIALLEKPVDSRRLIAVLAPLIAQVRAGT